MLNVNSKTLVISFFMLCIAGTAGCVTSQDASLSSPVPVTDVGPAPSDYGTGIGCSWTGQCYRHSEKTKKEMEKDLSECRAEGTMAAENSGSKGRMYIQEVVTFTSQCMLMRGYTWQ